MVLRDVFEQATLDLWQLQRLPLHLGLSCEHEAKQVSADGMTLGFRADRAHVHGTGAAPADGDIKIGSLFPQRLLVPDTAQRKTLAQFASSQPGSGLPQSEMTGFLQSFSDLPEGEPAKCLLPFLRVYGVSAGICQPASQKWRPALFSFGTPAPACQLLPRSCHPAAQQLVDDGAIAQESWTTLLGHSPVLHSFLQDTLLARPHVVGLAAVQGLVGQLLKVCLSPCECFLYSRMMAFHHLLNWTGSWK